MRPSDSAGATADTSGDTVKVGLLNSLSGTMAISEVTVQDSLQLAIEEINAAGGVLGKKLEPVIEDGASDWPTFAEKAQKLIKEDKVAAVFGGWTSASRKAVLPVFEKNKALLFYPVQYEGLEQSPYIFYTGATTNQQIVPGLDYLKAQGKKHVYLVGSDYVFPRTANKIIKAYAAGQRHDGRSARTTRRSAPPSSARSSTRSRRPSADAVFNTLNGDSNVAFFKQYKSAGPHRRRPCRSSRCRSPRRRSRASARSTSPASSRPGTTTRPRRARRTTKFVEAYKAKYGADKPTSDPMEAALHRRSTCGRRWSRRPARSTSRR